MCPPPPALACPADLSLPSDFSRAVRGDADADADAMRSNPAAAQHHRRP